jgi:hypothetical protein
MESGKVSLRKRKIGDLGALSLDEALEKFKLELSQRAV